MRDTSSPVSHCTFSLSATARLILRAQHGGQEEGVAAGHHVDGGQRQQGFRGVRVTVQQVHYAG